MDWFFERLGDFVRSILGEDSRPAAGAARRPSSLDPDMQEAWEELDAYLRGEEPRRRPEPVDPEREALRADYANLEVPFAAPFDQVKRSYRKLLAIYHPDRNSQDPEKQRLATEITQKINESYRRIEEFEERRRRSR